MASGVRGRCALFFYEGYLGVSPTNINLAKALSGAGYDVTIYSVPADAPNEGDMEGVTVIRLGPGKFGALIGALGVGRFRVGRVARRLAPASTPALFALRALLAELRAALSARTRTVYVGVDLEGAIAAALASLLLRRHFVFVSLELKFQAEQKRSLWFRLGTRAYRRAAAVLAQGPDRFDLIAREFGWRNPTTFTLPNSPFSDAIGKQPPDRDLFHAKFAIAPGTRIALQAGMIDDLTCASALAVGFARASGWALVLHERFKRSLDDPFIAKLKDLNTTNLFLSLDPVPYDQIDRVFAGADIGLAFYQPRGPDDDNFKFISSSGKLPHYLKHGKPVLVSNLPSLAEVVETYRCGIVISNPADPDEIAAALDRIALEYDEFSRNAVRCFAERYEFGKGAEPVIQFLDRL